jgi:hypothetical protein
VKDQLRDRRATARTGVRRKTNLNGHRVPLCPVTGKKRYRSREQAQQSLIIAARARVTSIALGRSTNRNEVRTYQCPHAACGGWHTTSQPLRDDRVGA